MSNGVATPVQPQSTVARRSERQRAHRTLAAAELRSGSPDSSDAAAALDEPKSRSWRPFQLAFLLVDWPALTDRERTAAPLATLTTRPR